MTSKPSFDLEQRLSLPDNLAYLRSTYPKADWRQQENFGELSALWLHVHDALREHANQLDIATTNFREGQLDPMSFRNLFVPRLNTFLQQLSGHHQVEDKIYFPKFRALDRRMAAGFDILDVDHEVIHGSLLATAESGRALQMALRGYKDAGLRAADAYAVEAERLLRLLVRHLADEEDLIIPAMLHHGERPLKD